MDDYWDPERGFRDAGEWGPKQPGSQEQDAKMTREQGAEESNLWSKEHRVCHKIMVFYTIEIFRLAPLGILTLSKPLHYKNGSYLQGSNLLIVR